MILELIKQAEIKTENELFPKISNRSFWENIDKCFYEDLKNRLPYFEENENKMLTASLFLSFYTEGNRAKYETVYFMRRSELVCKTMLECIENKGNYISDIVDLVWMILEETIWTVPTHHDFMAKSHEKLPDVNDNSIDLFLAVTAVVMTFVCQSIGEKLNEVSKSIVNRIKDRLKRTVIDDYLERDDYHWMLLNGERGNNWTPWITSNVLVVILALEPSKEKVKKAIEKSVKTLDFYINNYPKDGACDEGPVYWTQAGLSLVECLELIEKCAVNCPNLLDNPKIINIFEFVHKIILFDENLLNYGDGAKTISNYYGTYYKFAKRFNCHKLLNFAKLKFERYKNSFINSDFSLIAVRRSFDCFKYFDEIKNMKYFEESQSDYFFESNSLMVSKSDKIILTVKGGNNVESHNHNDLGSITVIKDNNYFIVDPGSIEYTRDTFSDKRYTIWNTRSNSHSVPNINGFEQFAGAEASVKNVSQSGSKISMDLSASYPKEAEIKSFIRSVDFDKTKNIITISENYEFISGKEIILNFPITKAPAFNDKKAVIVNNNDITIDFSNTNAELSYYKIESNDKSFLENWGELFILSAKFKINENKGIIVYKIY